MTCYINWCFLCAKEDDVEYRIRSLNAQIRTLISESSVLNYKNSKCPNRICSECYESLVQTQKNRERNAKVESLYFEIIRSNVKCFELDLKQLKQKHGVVANKPPQQQKALKEVTNQQISMASISSIVKQEDTSEKSQKLSKKEKKKALAQTKSDEILMTKIALYNYCDFSLPINDLVNFNRLLDFLRRPQNYAQMVVHFKPHIDELNASEQRDFIHTIIIDEAFAIRSFVSKKVVSAAAVPKKHRSIFFKLIRDLVGKKASVIINQWISSMNSTKM